jgi:hypothetical protein
MRVAISSNIVTNKDEEEKSGEEKNDVKNQALDVKEGMERKDHMVKITMEKRLRVMKAVGMEKIVKAKCIDDTTERAERKVDMGKVGKVKEENEEKKGDMEMKMVK